MSSHDGITILFIDETDAQLLVVDSFNRNTLGPNSLNNNANRGAGPAAAPGAPGALANQAQPNLFGTWQSALGTGLGFLAGSLFGRGLASPSYYGYPYYPYNYYYRHYPYHYYYYYYG
ncbi:unnamed protein product [Wuchereria bancrofti]|uniref:Uncharacterized protein n=1 Tax=Wuchereria bancrofti TaxID=6293 RepID=A0A3P7FYJ6_WUCBA|nr:unnamed protein product [Wuchereria bancrofti]